MPIFAHRNGTTWNEGYGIKPVGVEPVFEERVVNYWDERQVADCLIEDKLYEGYDLDPNVSIDELALYDAGLIIESRRRLQLERQEEQIIFGAVQLLYEVSADGHLESEQVHGV
jgi:hypothetical protein